MIIVLQEHLQEIYTHAESIYPEECCGLLLGGNGWREENCYKNMAN